MKIWKKTLALLLAFGMTASIAACGGSDGGKKEPAGEELEAGTGWATAWENTLTATNVKAEGYYNYSMYVSENLWRSMTSEGTIMLADNKYYSEGYSTNEWDYTGQGQDAGKINGKTEYYYGYKDGDLYCWYIDSTMTEWDEDLAYGDSEYFGTAFFMVEEFGFDMDRYDYVALENLVTYEGGVYSLSFSYAEDGSSVAESYQFKFVGGKLYSFSNVMTNTVEDAVITVEQSFTFSYGDAKIGKLPYEEGFGEDEKEEEKPGVGGGEEIGGSGGAVVMPDYSDVKGQEMHSVDEWNEVFAASCAETNLTAVGKSVKNDQTHISYVSIADSKLYMVNEINGVKSYEYMGEVDGVHYEWESADGKTWECESTDWPEDMNGGFAVGSLYGAPFEDFVYDAEKGIMVYEQGGLLCEVKILDGKIVWFLMEMPEKGSQEISIAYGNATVGELPPVENVNEGGDIGGVEIMPSEPGYSEEKWAVIVQNSCSETNVFVRATSNEDGMHVEETIQIADGKYYSEEEADGDYVYAYMGEVDGTYYVWESTDGETWVCMVMDPTEITAYYVLGMLEALDYSCSYYDAGKDMLIFDQDMMGENLHAEVRVFEGRIVEFSLTFMGTEGHMTIEYGKGYVGELPPVSGNHMDMGGGMSNGTTNIK